MEKIYKEVNKSETENINFKITTAYRDYNFQSVLYNNYVNSDGKLCVSSLLLKAHALANNGNLVVNDNNIYIDKYSNELEYPEINFGITTGRDLEDNHTNLVQEDEFTYEYVSYDGRNNIRIDLGSDPSLADAVAFTVMSRYYSVDNVQTSSGYTKLDKIGNNYYLVFYPDYLAGEYVENKSYTENCVDFLKKMAYSYYKECSPELVQE